MILSMAEVLPFSGYLTLKFSPSASATNTVYSDDLSGISNCADSSPILVSVELSYMSLYLVVSSISSFNLRLVV